MIEKTCRIIIAEPNDFIAYAAAKRVARERCECLGQTIGCHIGQNLKYQIFIRQLFFQGYT
jgi:hypothetical protein